MTVIILELIAYGFLTGLLYSLIGTGLALVWGVMKFVNFAHGTFILLASFMTWAALPLVGSVPYLSLLFIVPALFLLGAGVSILVVPLARKKLGNTEIENLSVALTFSLSIGLESMMLYIWGSDERLVSTDITYANLDIGPVTVPETLVLGAVAAIATVALLYVFIKRTYVGLAISAVSQDMRASFLMGINPYRIWAIALGISAALAAVAGTILAPIYAFDPYTDSIYTINAFLVVVLAGLGSIPRLILSGLLLGLGETIISYYVGSQSGPAILMLIVVAILVYVQGRRFGE